MTAAATDSRALTVHLLERGLIDADDDIDIRPLTGGVSNDVVAVRGQRCDFVVKRALDRLRVEQTWLADPARLDTEGRALRVAGSVIADRVPRVLDLDDGYLVIERAPHRWRTWKEMLLDGVVHQHIAEQLGRALGIWQRETAGNAVVAADFADRTAFVQLRLDPFHRAVRDRHPDLAVPIDRTVSAMDQAAVCLVHGDYTPKNVLVDPDGADLWVIDWEVAHLGDPTFDPAWILGHLLLKTLHRPVVAPGYAAAARVFLDALTRTHDAAIDLDPEQLIRQTGCLLLARVDGKSPVEYLDDAARDRARTWARRLLMNPPVTVTDIWELSS
ncbi:phosphotransferase family protein [Nocardia noduli]|uniref:phosphotransferase family protein n=1 Tax=Nocardia noduli TaxID=2815722 RepID=UPI001C21B7D4|nr:aminoglycoside phosphotransferase family protein [Nocardia noduli]